MYEAAERRGAMAESLKNDLEVMKRGHDEEMGEFSCYRRLTEEELEKAHQEYAQLQCMYKAAEERGVIAGALKVELDSVKTRHNDEIEELKAHLHQTRNELEMAHQAYAGLQSMYKVAEERGVFVEALKLELESVKKG
ncbi:hypothetical protein KP509_03G015600 [Ceratopteris richardii]|uniref:Uncharacterized protein n=1 Tax=Ceratopteris richardii TaxID=49495 RepID=A0A8T2UXG5_CERRI|nr:hypothetical protein KP509_03G015600 [Ceratopteris richardii]